MAQVQKLPDDAVDAIAKQVGRLYPSLDNKVTQRQPSAELTETFPVWFLSVEAINTGNDNLLDLAQDTCRWHSQISIDGKPKGVVRTMASGDDASDWTVRQILKSDFAKTIDDVIRWVDAEVNTDPLVKILEIPSFSITALWLIDGQKSSVVIARCPENLQSLSPLAQYSSEDFLEVLRQEPYPIGIRAKPLQLPRQDRKNKPKKNTFNVLSIDTNIDGIIPAMVLAEIEDEIGLPIADNFDLIAGTSAGGMLALGLSAGDDKGRPRYQASELVDICQTWRNQFFNPSTRYFHSPKKNLFSILRRFLTQGEKSSPNPQNVLGAYFHDATLADVSEKTKTMVTYYDTETSVPFFLKSWEPEHATVEMVRAAWLTSAVSTGFEPFRFSIGHETRLLFDGGVFIDSPVISVYEEARRIISEEENFNHFGDSDIFVLSLGTKLPLPTKDHRDLSFLGDNYVRLYPSLDEMGAYIDSVSKGNIANPKSLVDELIKSAEFYKVCNRLMPTT